MMSTTAEANAVPGATMCRTSCFRPLGTAAYTPVHAQRGEAFFALPHAAALVSTGS